MPYTPIVISLPTESRPRSFAFYSEAFGLEAIGEPAEDGVPEPLQFTLDGAVRLMLIPTGGFGWVTAGHPTAARGTSECLLSLTAGSEQDVRDLVERVRRAGGDVAAEPQTQPWGFVATVVDPDGHLWSIRAAD